MFELVDLVDKNTMIFSASTNSTPKLTFEWL